MAYMPPAIVCLPERNKWLIIHRERTSVRRRERVSIWLTSDQPSQPSSNKYRWYRFAFLACGFLSTEATSCRIFGTRNMVELVSSKVFQKSELTLCGRQSFSQFPSEWRAQFFASSLWNVLPVLLFDFALKNTICDFIAGFSRTPWLKLWKTKQSKESWTLQIRHTFSPSDADIESSYEDINTMIFAPKWLFV